ncbi:MAG: hypothetical protein H0W97_02215 [Actinobacteria bacterium]|nr:hypothetical protein [Actinomycetota bacterium]
MRQLRRPGAEVLLDQRSTRARSPDRLARLSQIVPSLEGSGVIYVLTTADSTRTEGIHAHAYSGGTDPELAKSLSD